ncbi:MAG: M23 family metallopeptidase [Spirochaetia bacterium]
MIRHRRNVKKVSRIRRWIDSMLEKGKKQLTIVVTPHDVSKVLQLRVTLMSVWVGLFLLTGLLIGVFVFSMGWVNANRWVRQTDRELQQAQASMAVIRSDIDLLRRKAEVLQDIVGDVSSHLGQGGGQLELTSGDLTAVQKGRVDGDARNGGFGEESSTLKEVISIIDQIEPGLSTIYGNFEAQKGMFQDMPTRWPIGGGIIGYLTQRFGPSRDPFTYEWQFHTGLDIAYSPGTPILSAANGTVVKAEYDPNGYGFYTVVRHRYGFYTLYGHMQRYSVKVGQEIRQGELIGYMGSSGRVTGPHLHFEVRIGTEVVDPMRYLTMVNQSAQRQFKASSKK